MREWNFIFQVSGPSFDLRKKYVLLEAFFNIISRMKNIVVFGGGDQAKMIHSICQSASRNVSVSEAKNSSQNLTPMSIKYYVVHEAKNQPDFLQFNTWLDKFSTEFQAGIVGVGDNFTRRKIASQIHTARPQFVFVTVIHPQTTIDPTVVVGRGTVIMPGAIINTGSKIGEHVVVNTGSIIEHDCHIQNFATVAPGAVLGGHVSVGENSFIGLGAKIIQQITIGSNAVIGAGSVVTENIPDNVLAYGNPCRVIRTRKPDEKYL